MTCNEYKGYCCFENYWQSGKVIEGIDKTKYNEWWKNQTTGKRRYPKSKGLKVVHSIFNGTVMDYITSRKKVYVPEYYEMVKSRNSVSIWRNKLKNGTNIVVYDFDGPRNVDGSVDCQLVTKELLIDKINDIKYPFGHGYIVASILLGINIEEFI